MKKVKLGISACLLGQEVRYDGGQKLDQKLNDGLNRFVEWMPVCPEAECGLTVPREEMKLVESKVGVRLVTCQTRVDHTERLQNWANEKLAILIDAGLRGYIFKSRSPSCGLGSVKMIGGNGSKIIASGIFARLLTDALPLLPVAEDENLHDSASLELFIKRIRAVD